MLNREYIIVDMDENNEIGAEKVNVYEDFKEASDAMVQYVWENCGKKITPPKTMANATYEDNGRMIQIWKIEHA